MNFVWFPCLVVVMVVGLGFVVSFFICLFNFLIFIFDSCVLGGGGGCFVAPLPPPPPTIAFLS